MDGNSLIEQSLHERYQWVNCYKFSFDAQWSFTDVTMELAVASRVAFCPTAGSHRTTP